MAGLAVRDLTLDDQHGLDATGCWRRFRESGTVPPFQSYELIWRPTPIGGSSPTTRSR